MVRRLSADDALAWARVAATIKPIGPREAGLPAMRAAIEAGEADLTAPPAEPRAATKQSAAKPAAPPAPADRSGERKVRRGKLILAASFDLHGHTQASAARALPAFLEDQRASDARCVLIITGKGRDGQGVLRRNLLIWLDSPPARRLISGYAESHPRHGGAGAFYVFLRRQG